MRNFKTLIGMTAIAVMFTLFSCTKNDELIQTGSQESMSLKLEGEGFIYAMTNDAEANQIAIYEQHADGTFELDSMMNTGGAGSGVGLGSQGAVVLNHEHTWLFAVNAGDNTISSFQVINGHLILKDVEPSQGVLPISVTVHGTYVYVLNSMSASIAGFMVDGDGMLTFMPGSEQPLTAVNADPAQIQFRPDGKELLVTEKATNRLTYFVLNENGVAQGPRSIPSKGDTPFGFAFASNDIVIVSNAEEGAEGASTVTSYVAQGDQKPKKYGPVENNQTAACWVAVAHGLANQAYVTNTGSNTISTYLFTTDGELALQKAVATDDAKAPIDIVVSGSNETFVYVLNAGSHSLTGYSRNADGTLTSVDMDNSLPVSLSGLAAFAQ